MKLANKLTRLHVNHRKTYEFLNCIFDILIKPIPITIWVLSTNNSMSQPENAIQTVIFAVFSVIGSYFAGIMVYLIYQATVQIIKLFACTYKRLVIHVRVFDIWVRLFEKKIRTQGTPEDRAFLFDHQMILNERNNKRKAGVERAYGNRRQRNIADLEYDKKEYERQQSNAEHYRSSAEAGFKSAQEGDGFFTTAEEKRKQAGRDLDTANWHSQMAEEERRRIENLERKLGK